MNMTRKPRKGDVAIGLGNPVLEKLGVPFAIKGLEQLGVPRDVVVPVITRALAAGVTGDGKLMAWYFAHANEQE